MQNNTVVIKVSQGTNDCFVISAQDETGGMMRYFFEKKYGTPKAGDKITLYHPNARGSKIVGMDLNGSRLFLHA
ncbi:MAG: hypothetical protein IJ689_06340 [Alphaproteobacteria bacterium]|nr:hypothetical protein [Alphaproteobacteria bacterium]